MTLDKADTSPKGFAISFTVIPLLTYILATCIVLWIWGISPYYVRDCIKLTARDFASATVRDLALTFGYVKGYVKESRFTKIHPKAWKFGIVGNWKYPFRRWKNLTGTKGSKYDQEAQI